MSAVVPVLFSATQRYRPLFRALAELGVDVPSTLRELGHDMDALLDPTTRIPREQAVALFRRLLTVAPRPDLGVMAAMRFELPDLGVLGYLLRHTVHARDALEKLARYVRLIADAGELTLTDDGDEVLIHGGLTGGRAFHPLGVDYTCGTLVRTIQEVSGGRALPLEVALNRPRPARVEAWRALFGEGVRFDSDMVVLRYDAEALAAPCPEHDPQLAAILEQHAQALLERLPGTDGFGEQLRSVIERQLAQGEPSVRDAAEQLGLSERTLRRKLVGSGTSYRDLLDAVRQEHALSLLGEGKLSISEIAQRVGFADATAFTRSFRRWTGKTPSALVDARRQRVV